MGRSAQVSALPVRRSPARNIGPSVSKRCRTFHPVAAIAVWLFLCCPAAAADITVVPSTISIPPSASANQSHNIYVSSKTADTIKLEDTDIEVVQGPDGWNPTNQSVTAKADKKAGSQVTVVVTPKREEFETPGTYKILLILKGTHTVNAKKANEIDKTTLLRAAVEISLKRPAAELKVKLESGHQYVLERS